MWRPARKTRRRIRQPRQTASRLSPAESRLKDFWRGSSTRSLERASHFCANLTRICGGSQLGLTVIDLNAEDLLKILGAQKPLAEVLVGRSLPLKVCLEGAYSLLIG